MYDLLTERLITVETEDGTTEAATLPSVLATLSAGRVAGFPALRPHQSHPWHAFLCQLAALALMDAGRTELPGDETAWRDMLRRLTPDWPDDEPWSLVVADPARPAFMQPGIAPAMIERKEPILTPDGLDILVTSKNHDLKQRVAGTAMAEQWLFALITLQTMEGFLGAGNYGISRMNGGFGSRPCLSLAPPGGPSAAFKRDAVALPSIAKEMPRTFDFYRLDGIGLVWLRPWTEETSLAMTDLHPLYIEVARRVRLETGRSGGLHARAGNSKVPRIDCNHLNGLTGDPWAPSDTENNKLLTLSGNGFTYRQLSTLLFDRDWRRAPLCAPQPSDPTGLPLDLVARCLVRGQGKTEGYHERVVPLTHKVVRAFGTGAGEETLGDLSRQRIADAGKIRKILADAVAVLAAAGALTEKGWPDTAAKRDIGYLWADRLETHIDAGYFAGLWSEFDAKPDERRAVRDAWCRDLLDRASALLDKAGDAQALPTSRRYRASARARQQFEWAKRKEFEDLIPSPSRATEDTHDDRS